MSSSVAKREAMLVAAHLPIGSTARVTCPVCNGGGTGEISFTVTRLPHEVRWHCHRASCPDASGERGLAGMFLPDTPAGNTPELREYTGEARPLESKDRRYFWERFELLPATLINNIFVTGRDEYVMPYRSPLGRTRGYVVRQPTWKGEPQPVRHGRPDSPNMPKTLKFRHTLEPALAWYVATADVRGDGDPDTVVIVEDTISAMKVAQECCTAVALLGTGLNEEKVRDIAQRRPKQVIIALDPDATGQAFRHARKWGMAFEKCRVALLERDPKDTPLDEIPEALGL